MPKQPNPKDYKKLDAIDGLMELKRYDEALKLALELTERRPKLVQAWVAVAEAAEQTKDDFLVWQAVRQLCQLEPREDVFHYNLINAAMQVEKLFLARQTVDTYLKRFPKSAYRQQVDKLRDVIEEAVQGLIDEGEIPAEPDTEAMALFETGELLTSHGRFAEGRRYSLDAARRMPDYPSPLNNVAVSYMVEGDYLKALHTLEQVQAAFPDNVFAKLSAVQVLVRLGRGEEAQRLLQTIARTDPKNTDHWHKLMETCAVAHEHALLLDVYKRATAFFKAHSAPILPAMHLLAGSAQAFLGHPNNARKEWKRVPNSALEHPFVEDLQRDFTTHGPWYFPLQVWIPLTWVEQLRSIYARMAHRSETALHREVVRLLEKTPGMISTMALMFERGDPTALELALNLSAIYPLPGLVEFAQGQRGTDEARFEAAQIAVDHGLLSRTDPITIVQDGKPTEALLMSFEVYDETTDSGLPDEAQAHLEAAYDAISNGDGARGLQEVEAALQIAPDYPALLNYKGNALRLLGRMDEADAVVRALIETAPDYLFAHVGMADICLREERFDDALGWLKPLLARERFHISEFRAIALTYIQLHLAMDQPDKASMWLGMMEDIDPDGVPPMLATQAAMMNAIQSLLRRTRKGK